VTCTNPANAESVLMNIEFFASSLARNGMSINIFLMHFSCHERKSLQLAQGDINPGELFS